MLVSSAVDRVQKDVEVSWLRQFRTVVSVGNAGTVSIASFAADAAALREPKCTLTVIAIAGAVGTK